ncbi:MAG: polyprenol monophosphomannose synthase [Porphyromonas sp.]|nr:polyprenol monophosphomannose synthase [Porphyromonas sp.]
MEPHQSLVIIPTYNERENVAAMIEAVLLLPEQFDVLIVDDASPDGTAEIVRQEQPNWSENRLNLLLRSGKQGLGTAYIAGFKWALEHRYNYIFEMDCDFSHPVEALPRLLKAVQEDGYDVSIGSRYVRGGRVKDWPLGRILMSYFASVYVRLVTWLPVADTTAGFVCWTRRVLENIILDDVHFKGYGFQIEMKYTAFCLGYRFKEVPITFVNRQLGSSKMSSSIFGEAFKGVLQLRFWHTFRRFPQRNRQAK